MSSESTARGNDLTVIEGGVQPDLIDVGERRRPGHVNEYGSMRSGLRTNMERFLNLIPADSPLAMEVAQRFEVIHEELGGNLSAVKAQLLRRFVVVGVVLDHWENMFLDGDVSASDVNNWYISALNSFSKLAQALGLERVAREAKRKSLGEIMNEHRSGQPAQPAVGSAASATTAVVDAAAVDDGAAEGDQA